MLYAVFSDVHSNLEAFEAFLEDAKKERIERYFCAGDIVGYGADPHKCIELTKSLDCPVVCGNHDWGVTGRFDIERLSDNARNGVLWTRDALDDIDKDFLNNLKPVYQNSEFTMVHGALGYPQVFDYILNLADAAKTIHLQKTPLCFVGHTHAAGIFYEDVDGYINYTTAGDFSMRKGRRCLVNAGSVGQPRDGDWRSSYCIYDNERHIVRIKRVEYDVRAARDKILKAGLPSVLADRILIGR